MNEDTDWLKLKQSMPVREIVEGVVLRHEPYGVFVDLGWQYLGLIQVTDFKDAGRMTAAEYPELGAKITAVVLGFRETGKQVWLGVKPSQIAQAKEVRASGHPRIAQQA